MNQLKGKVFSGLYVSQELSVVKVSLIVVAQAIWFP
jgi:hypothetical protein